jgi:hypothetical protein
MKFSFEGTPEELVALVTQLVAGQVARDGGAGGAEPAPREPVRYAPEGERGYAQSGARGGMDLSPPSPPPPSSLTWGPALDGDGYRPPGAPKMGQDLRSTTLQGGVPVGVSFPGTPGARPGPFSDFVDAFGEAASDVKGWEGHDTGAMTGGVPTPSGFNVTGGPLKRLIDELADRRWAREREAWLDLLCPWLGIMDQPAVEHGVSPVERVRLSGRLRDRLTRAFEEKGPALMRLVRLASERGAGITTLFRALFATGGAYPLMRETTPPSVSRANGSHQYDLAMTRLLAEHFVAVASACQMGNLFRLERISDAASYVVPRDLEALVRGTWRARAYRFDPDFAAIEHYFTEAPGDGGPEDDEPEDDEPNPNPDTLTPEVPHAG